MASYTATDVLSKILTVDGANSGLDADMVDGLHPTTTLPVPTNKSSIVSRDSIGNFTANLITGIVTTANALNGANATGFISRVGTDLHSTRVVTGTGNDITVANGDGISGNPTISAGANLCRRDSTNTFNLPQTFVIITANALSNDGNNNLFTGGDNLSDISTNGFLYVPMITGTPTGVPNINVGRSPVVWDATNNKLWAYSGGVWNNVARNVENGVITPAKLSTGGPTWDTSGNLTAPGDITAFSDERLKDNITNINDALSLVKQLQGVNFRYIESGTNSIGLIAQNVQNVLPNLVKVNENGILSVAYGNIVAVLIEAIKELSLKIEKLEKNGN